MGNKHTAAPWIVRNYNDFYVVEDKKGMDLCEGAENAQYNAQLMSAAPELLETTKSMLEFIEGLSKPKTRTYDPDYKNNIDNMIASAKEAIEKATTICSH